MKDDGQITVLLRQWSGGDSATVELLFEQVYPELKRIAGALFRREGRAQVLQPTGLVNELYLKLIRHRQLHFEDRQHFFSLSARLMRRILVDEARSQTRQKRDGGAMVPLHEDLASIDAASPEMLDLDRLLEELDQIDPRKCRMVELRYFLGFTAEETGEILGTSKPTVDRDLKFARAWLLDRLRPSE